jgi:TatA/E family protein of Tat protein translocase
VFGIGTQEMLLILVLALIVFGPKKLPEMGKSIGKSLRQFNQATQDIRDEFRFNLDADEEDAKPAGGTEFSPAETGSPNGSPQTGDGGSKTKTEAESEPGSPDPGPTA